MEELIKVADVIATNEERARQMIDAFKNSGFILAYEEDNFCDFEVLIKPEVE